MSGFSKYRCSSCPLDGRCRRSSPKRSTTRRNRSNQPHITALMGGRSRSQKPYLMPVMGGHCLMRLRVRSRPL